MLGESLGLYHTSAGALIQNEKLKQLLVRQVPLILTLGRGGHAMLNHFGRVGPATVTLRDIAFGLGDPDASGTPRDRTIDLLIDYDPGPHRLLVQLLQDPAVVLFA